MDTTSKLLAELKANPGSWISGEHLSTRLSVSRSAINKHIRKLKQMGYTVSAAPRRGYCLETAPDLLLPGEVKEGLGTLRLGQKEIVYLHQADSTNTRAKELAMKGAPEGTLVLAETQTMGRGRKGRAWHSPQGSGIYASLILRPALPPGEAPMITLVTAVAVCEAILKTTELTPTIKWPNDILINGKKIAGILTELTMEMDAVDFIIVGVGLNVNAGKDAFSEGLAHIATSMVIETGAQFNRASLLREYLRQMECHYDEFMSTGFAPIVRRWKELSDIIGRQVAVNMIRKSHMGVVVDVDNQGMLILEDKDGRLHRIISGDITIVD